MNSEIIANGVKSEKVCPHCGNDVFIWRRKTLETVLVNSNLDVISIYDKTVVDYYDDEPQPQPICNHCQQAVGTFVTEEFFHNVICDPLFDDTTVMFVNKKQDLDTFIAPFGFVRRDDQIEGVLAVYTDAVASRRVLVLEAQFPYDEDADEIEIEGISGITSGNTTPNDRCLDDQEAFTVLYYDRNGETKWYRSTDDREVRRFIQNLISTGTILEDIRLLGPTADVNIEDFMEEG